MFPNSSAWISHSRLFHTVETLAESARITPTFSNAARISADNFPSSRLSHVCFSGTIQKTCSHGLQACRLRMGAICPSDCKTSSGLTSPLLFGSMHHRCPGPPPCSGSSPHRKIDKPVVDYRDGNNWIPSSAVKSIERCFRIAVKFPQQFWLPLVPTVGSGYSRPASCRSTELFRYACPWP